MVFAIAINYGARDEMRRGMIRMAEDVKAGKLEPTAITEQAYTEIYVTDVLWPDFNKEELQKAVDSFGKRERRYGGRLTK